MVTLYIGQPTPVTSTRSVASSVLVSPADPDLAPEPLKLSTGISALILLTSCGVEREMELPHGNYTHWGITGG